MPPVPTAVFASAARKQFRTYRSSNPRRGDYEEIIDIPSSESSEENNNLLGVRKSDSISCGLVAALFFLLLIIFMIALFKESIEEYFSGDVSRW